MPLGMAATKSFDPEPGIELKAQGNYALAPHSRIDHRWYRPEPGRNVWTFGAIPDRWMELERITTRTLPASSIEVLPEDRREATRVMDQLLRFSTYRETVELIVNGNWKQRYLTRSEADIALVHLATHFLRFHDRRREVLYALLECHSEKAASHSHPALYLRITVDKALTYRADTDQAHVDSLGAVIVRSLLAVPPPSSPFPTCV